MKNKLPAYDLLYSFHIISVSEMKPFKYITGQYRQQSDGEKSISEGIVDFTGDQIGLCFEDVKN